MSPILSVTYMIAWYDALMREAELSRLPKVRQIKQALRAWAKSDLRLTASRTHGLVAASEGLAADCARIQTCRLALDRVPSRRRP
jgi:hypothetical protein